MEGTSAYSSTTSRGDLTGQILVVIGGSCGIGLEIARHARTRGATMILVARDPDPLYRAGLELQAKISAFDATDFDRLGHFFDALPEPVDHLVVTGRAPRFAPLGEFDSETAHSDLDAHLLLPLFIARRAVRALRPGGSLLLIGGPGGSGGAFAAALAAALPALAGNLALELAPLRVNVITTSSAGVPSPVGSPGRADDYEHSPLSAPGAVRPADVAALAAHLMLDTAITGATVDVAGGRHPRTPDTGR